MRVFRFVATAFFLFLGPAALADSIQASFSSTATANVSSPNDSYWASYYNVASEPFFLGNPTISTIVPVPLPTLSVSLPAGSTFLDAVVSITVSDEVTGGTAQVVAESPFESAIDPTLPSIAPTFSDNGVAKVFTETLPHGVFYVINGNEVSTGYTSFDLLLSGSLLPALADPGSNWAGFIGGDGQVDIPYTLTLDVTYSPVPEPSSFVLLGTGLLALFRSRTARKLA